MVHLNTQLVSCYIYQIITETKEELWYLIVLKQIGKAIFFLKSNLFF